MDAYKELRREQKLMQYDIKTFMESTDVEESRVLCNSIKDRATRIVNLRKEIKGEKELRREYRRKRR